MGADFVLHPLIYTFAMATMVLHVGTGQKRRECGLNYVIYILGRPALTSDLIEFLDEMRNSTKQL